MSFREAVTAALRDARSSRVLRSGREPASDGVSKGAGSSGSGGEQRSLRSERSEHHEGPFDAVIFQGAALVLAYPEQELIDRLDVIESALATDTADLFAPVINHLHSQPLAELQSFHVQEFDLSRKHALHLSYWTDGDTRRRGEVLADIKRLYRESGLLVDTGGELPDYLPMVLEFAVADPERGRELLQRFRASLELIRLGLEADRLPHAGVLKAICGCLPGESPTTRVEVQAKYGDIQPVEFVGLDVRATGNGIPAFAGMTRQDDPGSPVERGELR